MDKRSLEKIIDGQSLTSDILAQIAEESDTIHESLTIPKEDLDKGQIAWIGKCLEPGDGFGGQRAVVLTVGSADIKSRLVSDENTNTILVDRAIDLLREAKSQGVILTGYDLDRINAEYPLEYSVELFD